MAAEASASSSTSKPAIGIISIGDMGSGIARLLRAHDYPVFTSAAGRSSSTLDRIKSAHVTNLPTDEELVAVTDIILSIVPPRDAVANARRIVQACTSTSITKRGQRAPSVTYIDLNAISPRSAKTIESLISSEASPKTMRKRSSSFPFKSEPDIQPIPMNFLDGGIIGGPPSRQPDKTWKRPSIVISGPRKNALDDELSSILNLKHINDHIGPASALKACFASLTKGFTALSILSFTTASACGVLPELQAHLEEFNPMGAAAARGITNMPPKAYRWVDEMTQIGETFADQGGFANGRGGQKVFDGVSEIYKFVAEGTELGAEKTENRKRGRTVEDVAKCMREGMRKRTRSGTEADEDLSLTWRSSWS